jgi:glycine hydroxymethyltransferase
MKQLDQLITAEEGRQARGLELIPSENYASPKVRRALGTVYTNKYAEGYPGRRYYGGQEYTDQAESWAIDGAKKLFGADHANVQPHAGAPANLAAYFAWCDPGDTILAMDLTQGGHLTHGAPVTIAAKLFNFVRYGMKDVETGEIDYEALRRLAQQHRPKIILAGFTSYPRELDYAKFTEIADEVGAVAMADIAHIAGLIAAGELANPFDYGFKVLTSTTHKTLRGPRGGLILSRGQVSSPLKAVERTIENLPTLIDRAVFPGLQGGPHMNVILAKAVAFEEAQQPEFRTYAKAVLANAKKLAAELVSRDIKLVTGGTDNHLIVIDTIESWGIGGKEVQELLDQIGLITNKNVTPNDPRPASDPTGIRIGTPAITTRGMGEAEMIQIASWIGRAVKARPAVEEESVLERLFPD